MKKWFSELSVKDRQLVILMLVVIGVFIVYQAMESFESKVENLKVSVAQHQNTYQWMKQAAVEINAYNASNSSSRIQNNKNMLGLIDVSSKRAAINKNITKIEAESDNAVRVWMENASFDDTLRWLDELIEKYGLVASEINIESQDKQGLVNLRMRLKPQS